MCECGHKCDVRKCVCARVGCAICTCLVFHSTNMGQQPKFYLALSLVVPYFGPYVVCWVNVKQYYNTKQQCIIIDNTKITTKIHTKWRIRYRMCNIMIRVLYNKKIISPKNIQFWNFSIFLFSYMYLLDIRNQSVNLESKHQVPGNAISHYYLYIYSHDQAHNTTPTAQRTTTAHHKTPQYNQYNTMHKHIK